MKFSLYSLVATFIVMGVNAEEIDFDTVEISAKEITNEQKPFVTSGAVSSRPFTTSDTQSIDSVIRSIPGAYTQIDQSQGTVSVNVRGMTGLGRVNTMVDGVTQTFYGTSADGAGGKYHGGSATSAFGATIDPNFLVGVDITKGATGGHSGNALMGSANFRTIEVDDIVRDGNTFGFLGKYSYGTNAIGSSYMGSVAGKYAFDDKSGYLGALYGYSGKKISQNYKDGNGRKLGDPALDIDGEDRALNPDMLTQRQRSHLMKFEVLKDANKAILSHRRYRNVLAGRRITNENTQLNYDFNPENDLINLNFLAAYNLGKQRYNEDASFASGNIADGATTQNKAITLDLGNTFTYDIGASKINSKLGINYLHNKYQKRTRVDGWQQKESIPFAPDGKQELITWYLNNNLEYENFALDLNANLLSYELAGHRQICEICIPSNTTDIKKTGTKLNGDLTLSYKFDDLFTPFVTYSVTHRVPTVQEMFFSTDGGNGVNPFLKPEQAKTWQIGFDAFKHGVLNDNDVFGLKVLYYNSRVKNYIYNKQFYVEVNGFGHTYIFHVNDPDITKFHGWEAELSYDTGFFYLKGAYSRQTTTQPTSWTFTGQQSYGLSGISELPKDYANINVGTRLFDETLELGTTIKYTGKAKMTDPRDRDDVGKSAAVWNASGTKILKAEKRYTTDVPKIPTIIDIHAEWKTPIKGLTIRGEVQNVFNKNYYDALSKFNDTLNSHGYNQDYDDIILYNNSARGRTYFINFEYRY